MRNSDVNSSAYEQHKTDSFMFPIEEMSKIQITTDCSRITNENGLSSLKAESPTTQTQEETTSDNRFHDREGSSDGNTSVNSMCPPQDELPVPVYIPTHPSHSGGDNDGGMPNDDGSVSSLESYDKDFPMPSSHMTKRPIFAKYWQANDLDLDAAISYDERQCATTKKNPPNVEDCRTTRTTRITRTARTASASYTHSRCAREATMPFPDEFAYQEFKRDFSMYNNTNGTNDVYEDILKINEQGRTSMPCATSIKEVQADNRSQSEENQRNILNPDSQSQRYTNSRTLFANKYSQSSPSLMSYGYREPNPVRKTSSATSLRKKQRSILRSRSCSIDSIGLGSLQSSSSKLSVSFDSRVYVHEYEKPVDRYAAQGWSKWFV